MITFDDTRLDQYTAALLEPEPPWILGVFFIMTVALDRPWLYEPATGSPLPTWVTPSAPHTWDHHNVKTIHRSKPTAG